MDAESGLKEGVAGDRVRDDRKAQLRKLYWYEVATSLWGPLTLFLVLLTLYIFLVQLFPELCQLARVPGPGGELEAGVRGWPLRAIQLLGLGCLAYFVVLAALRIGLPGFSEVRKLRVEAGELAKELRALVKKHQAKLEERSRKAVLEAVDALEVKRLAGEKEPLKKALDATAAVADKHLAAYRKSSPLDFVSGIGKPLLAALLIRTVLIEPFYIPTGSMIPTVLIEDRVLVNRFIYGVRIPFINVVPFPIIRRPARGDVIVFNNPVDPSVDYIKRVVGVPGDKIELVDDVVHVNGQPQPRELLSEDQRFYDMPQGTDVWIPKTGNVYKERLNGSEHLVQQLPGYGQPNSGPYSVPEGHVFVMGDNRDASADSRFGLGDSSRGVAYVPYGNIKGKAMVVWLSLSYGGLFNQWFGGKGLRTDRMFMPVR